MAWVRDVVWGLFVAAAVAVAVAVPAGPAAAQPKPPTPPLVGATELARFAPAAGFIDDAIAADGDRLAYVVSDAASKCELHLVTLSTKAEQVIDLAPATLHPIALELVGPRLFVVGLLDDGKQTAALVELAAAGKSRPAGRVAYKLGPATHITVIARDGVRRVAVHRAIAAGTGTRHEVELVALETGRRLAAGRPLELDATGANKPLDLRVNHWSDGYTRAYGIKGGEWDRKENQRSPDTEATYDLILGKIADTTRIADLIEQRRRYQALADSAGQIDFARMSWDASALQVWTRGKPRAIELDQPLAAYDPKSLQGAVASDGSAWLALKVNPVNVDAVARKKADPEYLDVFRVPPEGKAARRARVLATGVRDRFGPLGPQGDRFWLIERNQGFERGGKSLTLYQAQ